MHTASEIEFRYRDIARWTWIATLTLGVLTLLACKMPLWPFDGDYRTAVDHLDVPPPIVNALVLALFASFAVMWLLSPLTWLVTRLLGYISHPGWHLLIWTAAGAAAGFALAAGVISTTADVAVAETLRDPALFIVVGSAALASGSGWLYAYRGRFSDSVTDFDPFWSLVAGIRYGWWLPW